MKKSAGLLWFRRQASRLEVLLVHPGGPFWATKDWGAWSIPKGEFQENEDPLQAAKREFAEETGVTPIGDFIPLKPVMQPGGKLVYAWALNSDFDPKKLQSNTFAMEWPPKSGRHAEFPEVDRADWFSIETAKGKILQGQLPILLEIQEKLTAPAPAE